MSLTVTLVVPDRELWSGTARTVIAKTTEGDIGVLSGHSPVFGIVAEGSLVEILDVADSGGAGDDSGMVRAAVSGGFLSVADDHVRILAAVASLSTEVDPALARSALETALADGGHGPDEPAEAKYARAQLRATGAQA